MKKIVNNVKSLVSSGSIAVANEADQLISEMMKLIDKENTFLSTGNLSDAIELGEKRNSLSDKFDITIAKIGNFSPEEAKSVKKKLSIISDKINLLTEKLNRCSILTEANMRLNQKFVETYKESIKEKISGISGYGSDGKLVGSKKTVQVNLSQPASICDKI
jgi:hypothetical protein